MKRILRIAALASAFALCLVLAGCGGGNSSPAPSGNNQGNGNSGAMADVQNAPSSETLETEETPDEQETETPAATPGGGYTYDVQGRSITIPVRIEDYFEGTTKDGVRTRFNFERMCADCGFTEQYGDTAGATPTAYAAQIGEYSVFIRFSKEKGASDYDSMLRTGYRLGDEEGGCAYVCASRSSSTYAINGSKTNASFNQLVLAAYMMAYAYQDPTGDPVVNLFGDLVYNDHLLLD